MRLIAMAMMILTSAQVYGQANLVPDRGLAGQLVADEVRVVGLEVGPGDYLEGELVGPSGALKLELIDDEGTFRRLLIDAGDVRRTFRFVADNAGQQLRLSALMATDFELQLTRQVVRADQLTPSRNYLSGSVAEVAETLANGGSTEGFWQQVAAEGTPLVEPLGNGESVLTFLARGATHNVRLFGAPSGNHEELERLGESDIWFRSYVVPDSTRLSYQLAPDVPEFDGTPRERRVAILATAQADPLNRFPWPQDAEDVFRQDSTVTLPEAPDQSWLMPREVPRGALEALRFTSATLGNERDILIYRPAGYDPANPDNLLLFVFDADAYTTKVPTPTILDNLIAAGELPPVLAVFVGNPSQQARARELPANPDFAQMMAQELLPWVETQTGSQSNPERTILAGSSYGGLASTTIALTHPETFGNVLSLSGSYWWHPPGTPAARREYVAEQVATSPARPVRFFLSAGLFETEHGGAAGILDTSRHLRDVLVAKAYPVAYREYAAAHDYFAWRGVLADGLLALAELSGWAGKAH